MSAPGNCRLRRSVGLGPRSSCLCPHSQQTIHPIKLSSHLLGIHDVETRIRHIPAGRNKEITPIIALGLIEGLHEIDARRHHIRRLELLLDVAAVVAIVESIVVVEGRFVGATWLNACLEEQAGKRQ